MQLLSLLIASLPLTALAGDLLEGSIRRRARHAARGHRSSSSPAPAPTSAPSNSSGWNLVDKYQGESFFNDWDFWTYDDPTHGQVNFISQDDANSKGLAYVSNGQAVMAVDDTNWLAPGKPRDSVRISSKKSYNGGLFIADFAAAPYGCGTWPAWWTVGPEWPSNGEIDVLEGVHNNQHNQMTLHTSEGCSLDTSPQPLATTAKGASGAFTGQVLGTTCASGAANNDGCGVLNSDTRSYGAGFNGGGGGVFAHQWNSKGITIWQFGRDEVPQDITDGEPNPGSWPTPAAYWSAASCDSSHFANHQLVFDITLCGDWAGAEGVYEASGCPGTCASAVQDPSNFQNAKFAINYVAVYSQ